jgi:hypothetical protein
MTRFHAMLFAIPILLTTAPLAAQPAAEPTAIVSKLYDASIKGADAAFGLRKSDRRILSKSLNQLWSKADAAAKKRGDEIGPVDFDVVSMSQDPNVKSYKVTVEKQDNRIATIAANFMIGDNNVKSGETVIVRYDFVRENGSWLVDDVRSSINGKPYSLRRNLEASLKN